MTSAARTRIAPTPSGFLHLGNAFSFALTAFMARRHGARIFLRIDDLDSQRVRRAYVEDIFDTLHFLDIPWDEGPRDYAEYQTTFSQQHRMALYREALDGLRETGLLFACDCSRSSILRTHPQGLYTGGCLIKGLPLEEPGCSWRIDTTNAELPPEMAYFVVRKKDECPAYQLASLVDDQYFGVDLIVRGQDLEASTQAQQFLARVLGYRPFLDAAFHHHRLLPGPAGGKLSKSAGSTSVQYLRQQGFRRSDCYAMIGRLAGLDVPVSHWEELGQAILNSGKSC